MCAAVDALLLSRLQFALTIMFHYLFPPLAIGMGIVLVYLEAMYFWKKDPLYEVAAKFWTKIFGLNFAVGVVTGIVMEFEFGTNWAVYSRYVGDVFGSALAAEGIFAFFLESGFLALLIFGWDRVGPKTHLFATTMVALGSIFSSIWIVVANSWQQTPAGHVLREHVVNGQVFTRAEIVDFWAVVFNPSAMHRLVHVWIGAFLVGAFFIMSISAWYVLRNVHLEFARRSFAGALLLATISALAQIASGDLQSKNVYRHQPAKMAAMEGIFKTENGATLYMAGWPDEQTREVRYGIGIPGMLSWLLFGDANKPVAGFDQLREVWGQPPVWLTFQAYHVMVGVGFLFVGATLFATFCLWRGTLFSQRWLMWCFVLAIVPAVIANELGWVTAEVGRQPWIVYPTMTGGKLVPGLMTQAAISESVAPQQVFGSIIMFGMIYALLLVLWIVVLNHKIQLGPEAVAIAPEAKSGWLGAASERVDHEGSLTEAKREKRV
jgi:cytochrome d ubiquinol oxidase subunit I